MDRPAGVADFPIDSVRFSARTAAAATSPSAAVVSFAAPHYPKVSERRLAPPGEDTPGDPSIALVDEPTRSAEREGLRARFVAIPPGCGGRSSGVNQHQASYR
jgi:hypothetical protein